MIALVAIMRGLPMSVKRITTVLISLVILTGFAYIGFKDAVKTKEHLDFQQIELKSKSSEIKSLNVQYEKLNDQLDKASQEKDTSQEDIQKLQKEKQDLEKQKQDLEAQLQAKLDAKSKIALASEKATNALTLTGSASAASFDFDCANPPNDKAFIYCHESGNNPAKWNSSGCYGLGQDCNGVVYNRCGADYACQDAYFTNEYMPRRYGSWAKAKAFWLARVPINGRDVGNWW